MLRLAASLATVVLALHAPPATNPNRAMPRGPISATATHEIVSLDRIASKLAGHATTVNCWSQTEWTEVLQWRADHHYDTNLTGLTFPRQRRVGLDPLVCATLAQIMNRTESAPLYDAWALAVLAHESAHASGVSAENKAECAAVRTLPRTAELFGLPPATALRLQRVYRGTIYPDDLPRYRTPACPAGEPAIVSADELGSGADLHTLEGLVRQAARELAGWRRIGGSVGPLSKCAPVRSRAEELARYGDQYVLGSNLYTGISMTTLRSTADVPSTVSRLARSATCDLAQRRDDIRAHHSKNVVRVESLGAAVTRISPGVRGYRVVLTYEGSKHWTNDTVFVINARKRLFVTLQFSRTGLAPRVVTEARIVAALLKRM